jgi:guanylate kinase
MANCNYFFSFWWWKRFSYQSAFKNFPKINALNNYHLTCSTTRPKRRSRLLFYSPQEFQKKIEDGKFVEYNFYAGNFYGTEKKILEESLKIKT